MIFLGLHKEENNFLSCVECEKKLLLLFYARDYKTDKGRYFCGPCYFKKDNQLKVIGVYSWGIHSRSPSSEHECERNNYGYLSEEDSIVDYLFFLRNQISLSTQEKNHLFFERLINSSPYMATIYVVRNGKIEKVKI